MFLGPRAENHEWLLSKMTEILKDWVEWRKNYFPQDGVAITQDDQAESEFKNLQNQMSEHLKVLLARYQKEIPTFSPRYLGHMLSEIALPALLGNLIALVHNPNLVSAESSQVGVQIEKEAIQDLIKMVGWNEGYGHFTSGGTIANYEALFRAREKFYKRSPQLTLQDTVIFIPRHRHYSWKKGAHLMGFKKDSVWQIDLDEYGRVDLNHLQQLFEQAKQQSKEVIFVVSVMGTTECGIYDDVFEVAKIIQENDPQSTVWHHVDAAYGGFFCSVEHKNCEWDFLKKVLLGLKEVQSLTLDPHKLAYVPYSCGAFLCKKREDYAAWTMDAPYLEFGGEIEAGRFSLEGSRAGTGATATWMMSKAIQFNSEGLGRLLRRTVSYKDELKELLLEHIPNCFVLDQEGSNILCFVIGKPGESIEQVNQRTLQLYQNFSVIHDLQAQDLSEFMLSKTTFRASDYSKLILKIKNQLKLQEANKAEDLLVLRMCLMNPFIVTKEMRVEFLLSCVQEIQKQLEV